tara:strand:+ start:165 stop:503 length:339 start_codon:yes stop_codon:yes gene_type:complete
MSKKDLVQLTRQAREYLEENNFHSAESYYQKLLRLNDECCLVVAASGAEKFIDKGQLDSAFRLIKTIFSVELNDPRFEPVLESFLISSRDKFIAENENDKAQWISEKIEICF